MEENPILSKEAANPGVFDGKLVQSDVCFGPWFVTAGMFCGGCQEGKGGEDRL